MKRAFAIFALLSIALNAMAGGVGTILICTHIDGKTHSFSASIEAKDLPQSCCDHGLANTGDDCKDCVDKQVNADEFTKATPSSERSLIKAFSLQPIALLSPEVHFPVRAQQFEATRYSRGPPEVTNQVARHIETTVLRV